MPAEPEPHDPRTGCAASEPRDDADRAISALLWRAGELKRWLEHPDAERPQPSGFESLLEEILTRTDGDAALGEDLDLLVRMLGQGTALQLLFQELFQPSARPVALSLRTDRRTDLSDREREVLAEMAKGLSYKEIAAELSRRNGGNSTIKPATVRTYIWRIYDKLQVDNPWDAVTLGEALGLIPAGFPERIERQESRLELSLNQLTGMLRLGGERVGNVPRSEALRRLASLGALLLCLAALPGALHALETHPRAPRCAWCYCFSPEGKLLRCAVETVPLCRPVALAFVPPAAAAHGFVPGHLVIIEHGTNLNALNNDSIAVVDPAGGRSRTFTGGAYLSTRLTRSNPIAFTSDGRLLVGTGAFTDAVLEFTAGGRKVRRFASLTPYSRGMVVDGRDNVYVVGGTQRDNAIQVFDRHGQHVRSIGDENRPAGQDYRGQYQDLALDSAGRLYVASQPADRIEVFHTDGRPLEPVQGGGLCRPWRVAMDSRGRLYVLEGSRRRIRVCDTRAGTWRRSFSPPGDIHLEDLAVGPDGNLWAVGWEE